MKKILIVDDEPHNRTLLQETLEYFEEDGGKLFFAVDGSEALDILHAEKPGLMFLDIMLPDMDGLDICRRVKTSPGFEKTFIVILTALSQDSDRIMALGVSDMFISKPFKINLIKDVVNRVFGYAEISWQV
jgi:two-component system alkaline phosphatase synthesis response regulator PhoP